MKKVIAFGASSSNTSINQRLAVWAASQVDGVEIKELNLNDYEAPLYSVDAESDTGFPQLIQDFKSEINSADGIVISLAEHNGNFTAAFKNLYDWLSRMDRSVWNNAPMLLLSSSPGPGAGSGAMAIATRGFAHAGGNIVGSYSLPSFMQNFNETGISNTEARAAFNTQLALFQQSV
jgi:chromate reductase